jgi:hypothetical protein
MLKLKYFPGSPKVYLFVIALIYLLITSYFYHNKVFSIHFVDEEYNFTLGKQLLYGDKLYSDVTTNHQPLAFILSAGVQKITNPNSIYLLVKRHREVVILFSVICSLLLVLRFGISALSFLLIYEPVKIYLLGNLFLAETLIVYPLIYLTGLILSRENKLNEIELWFCGICLSFMATMLLPMWPISFFIFLLLIFTQKKKLKTTALLLAGTLPILLLVLFFSSPAHYYDDIFIFNAHFIQNNESRGLFQNLFSTFTAPIISFFVDNKQSSTLQLINFLSLGLIIAEVFLVLKKKYFIAVVSLLVLGISNLRYFTPGQESYQGFHLLPWFALLIFTVSTIFSLLIIEHKKVSFKIFFLIFLIAAVVLSLNSSNKNLFNKEDTASNLYINYSNQFTMGEAIKIMAGENLDESVFVSPDEWLIYWQSNLKTPREINTYYPWMIKDPFFAEKLQSAFDNQTFVYFYCDCEGSRLLEGYLKRYEQMSKDGAKTRLFVLPEKLKKLTKAQRSQLEFYGFNLKED